MLTPTPTPTPSASFAFQALLLGNSAGRLTSIDLLASEGGQPIGYALAGPAGAAVGAHTYLAAGAATMLLVSSVFALLRPLRTRIT